MTLASSPVPRAPLMALDEARERLLSSVEPLSGIERVACFDADGRVLADALVSPLHVPPQDNSSMDGYAVRCADVPAPGVTLRVTQRIPAGHRGVVVGEGEAARIFTGAPVPPGADAVVMQEDTEAADSAAQAAIRVMVPPTAGQWIRRAGEDVACGDVVLRAGTRLGPAALGLAASLGAAHLDVVSRPRVALFSTGDELVMPGQVPPEAMPPGAIYNSNRFFLRALLHRMGCEVSDLGIVPDRREATVAALRTAADHHDLILTSGGVSVGEEDHVKPAVQSLGSLDLWQIAMKPGKPFAHGRVRRDGGGMAHFIGLPGNPVSSFVTFLWLVRPFLLRLQGMTAVDVDVVATRLRADFDLPRGDRRREFLRARRNGTGGVDLFPNQSSGVLTSVVSADGLIDNPPGQAIAAGDTVSFIPFQELLA
jgi:molybdopterin molybdotransferase